MLTAIETGLTRTIAGTIKRAGGPSLQSARTLVQLRNRPYLPGSESPNFPEYLAEFRDDLPYKIKVPEVKRENLAAFAKEFRPTLDKHIAEHGAVLIRGLPLPTAKDFSEFFGNLDLSPMDYVGGSGVRQQVAHKVSTASNEPPEFNIEPHNEMCYLPYWPHLLFFYCDIPPEPGCGGECGITDVREIYKNLDDEVKEKLGRKGVRYHRYLRDRSNSKYSCWQDSMMTESRDEAEQIMKETGQQFRWEEDGALSFWTDNPAIVPHFRTGEMLWFNQAHANNYTYFQAHPILGKQNEGQPSIYYPFTTFYRDGSSIELEYLQHIREVSWRCTVGGQLKKADVVVLDNMLMQHSRISFTGQRKLLVSLAKYKEYI